LRRERPGIAGGREAATVHAVAPRDGSHASAPAGPGAPRRPPLDTRPQPKEGGDAPGARVPLRTRPLLLGRGGPRPFSGYFLGEVEAEPGAASFAFAGRVGPADDVETAWRASRAVHRALVRAGAPRADRRRALSILWARVDAVDRDVLGPARGDDLSLLLVVDDEEGLAVSAAGLDAVYGAAAGGTASAWVVGEHPLLGVAGFPTRRPGALTVPGAAAW